MKPKIVLIMILLSLSIWASPSHGQLQCSASGYSSPTGIEYDGSTQTFWVAVFGGNYVAKLNLSCHELARYTVGRGPFGLTSDGSYIWVTNYTDGTVSKLQMSTGAVVGTYAVGSHPRGVTLWASSVWVANEGSNNVTKLDISTGALQGTFTVGSAPYNLVGGTTGLWVVNLSSNTIMQLDSGGEVIQTLSTPSQPQYLAIATDAAGNALRLFVSCYSGKKVAIFNIAAFPASLITNVDTSAYSYPTGIAISWDGTDVVTHNGYIVKIVGSGSSYGVGSAVQIETSTRHLLSVVVTNPNVHPPTLLIDDVDDGMVYAYDF